MIALFMGWTLGKDNYYAHPINRIYVLPPDFRYHNSWGWLMPVVEKIESEILDGEVSVVIDGDNCHIHVINEFDFSVFEYTKIESTWRAIIKFIQWYNTNHS